jgi:transposase InsO family protein
MRDNSFDRTIERNYVQKWRFLIKEYEQVKAGRSETFGSVGAFYRHHGTCSQTFRKYYNRYLLSGSEDDLLPRKRGPRWAARRMTPAVEAEIAAARRLGLSRYEIYAVLAERRPDPSSPSAIYRAFRRQGTNRRDRPMQEEKRRIIREKAGELAHVDLHRVPRDAFLDPPKGEVHLVGVICTCARLAWAEVVIGKKALPVMFQTLKALNTLNQRYGLRFCEALTDNGAEFAGRTKPEEHPFEAMLINLGIKHRYTRPYRPQTNGKIERFWRSLGEDMIEGTTFDSLDHFSEELFKYMIYYNEFRPHHALGGIPPKAFLGTLTPP